MIRQWAKIFWLGTFTALPSSITVALACTYLASNSKSRVPQGRQSPKLTRSVRTALQADVPRLYSIAAALPPCIIPFTLLMIRPVYNALLAEEAKAKDAEKSKSEKVVDQQKILGLLNRFYYLNMARAMIVLSSAVVGITAVMKV
jgi:H+/gluconate symporter-like permease